MNESIVVEAAELIDAVEAFEIVDTQDSSAAVVALGCLSCS